MNEIALMEDDEMNAPMAETESLFQGGSAAGNIVAHYTYNHQKIPMKFQFFGLEKGRVFGQGDDAVGSFTLAGKYTVESGHGNIHFVKQYVGKHKEDYQGRINFFGAYCFLNGHWHQDSFCDKFSIRLKLPYETHSNLRGASSVGQLSDIFQFLEVSRHQRSSQEVSKVATRFEEGTVAGKYYQCNHATNMFFKFFTLRDGRVSGQGQDEVGDFTMSGQYDVDGNVSLIKKYIGQHNVLYTGMLICDSLGGFCIEGIWLIGHMSDKFCIHSVTSTANI